MGMFMGSEGEVGERGLIGSGTSEEGPAGMHNGVQPVQERVHPVQYAPITQEYTCLKASEGVEHRSKKFCEKLASAIVAFGVAISPGKLPEY